MYHIQKNLNNQIIKTNDSDVDLSFSPGYYFMIKPKPITKYDSIIVDDIVPHNFTFISDTQPIYNMPYILTDSKKIIDIPYYSGLSNPYKFKTMISPLIHDTPYHLKRCDETKLIYTNHYKNNYNNLNLSPDFYSTNQFINYDIQNKPKVLLFDTKKFNISFILENSKENFDSNYDKNIVISYK